ncbi:MAG TPA: rRNA pseudouridine synthase [Deltaproteobacteria bacterium]|nr:rRNA pseudouridine synthase [Deltaproteobacteria bacterium]
MSKIRINKFIASTGAISRRKADELVQSGRVAVNSEPAHIGDIIDTQTDEVSIDGKIVSRQEILYLALNKPRFMLTSMYDPLGRPCIKDLIPSQYTGVFPVGRLDFDAEGLLLLTNDGDLAQGIHHPSHSISKVYIVQVKPCANPEQIREMCLGVYLDGTKTRPAQIEQLRATSRGTTLRIVLKQGLKNQIKRMALAVGLEVISIRRISVGPVEIDALAPGDIRNLTPVEISNLHKMLKIHKKP